MHKVTLHGITTHVLRNNPRFVLEFAKKQSLSLKVILRGCHDQLGLYVTLISLHANHMGCNPGYVLHDGFVLHLHMHMHTWMGDHHEEGASTGFANIGGVI